MSTENGEKKFEGSVKIMRSYDYCHFEVNLSTPQPMTLSEIDGLRKDVARLVDKAVGQFQVAKQKAERCREEAAAREYLKNLADRYLKIPESERSPEQVAVIKEADEASYQASKAYDYEDDVPW
jgi:Mg2+ and Co2+ transporter CorA